MKIESNETFECYETTCESWNNGKDITLDGVRLVPVTILEELAAEIRQRHNVVANDSVIAGIVHERNEVLEIIHKYAAKIDSQEG